DNRVYIREFEYGGYRGFALFKQKFSAFSVVRKIFLDKKKKMCYTTLSLGKEGSKCQKVK
ncbi:MAG: hypothetical protein COT45_05130, partial [bacterium (Candidatus Stahlbacteria) CG08_land_8_20_14_0_20_40_26]